MMSIDDTANVDHNARVGKMEMIKLGEWVGGQVGGWKWKRWWVASWTWGLGHHLAGVVCNLCSNVFDV